MEKEIINLSDKDERKKLVQLLNTINNSKIFALVDNRIAKGRDPTSLIHAIFVGSPEEDAVGLKRHEALFKHCVEILQTNDLQSKLAIELLGQLMIEVDSLLGVFLAELAEYYVDSIKTKNKNSGKYLELLPKILSALSEQEHVTFRGDEMKGQECKDHVINSLCSVRWESASVLSLVAMFRDVTMTSDELRFVMEKVVRMFPDVALDELPPLIFQLLLLANQGHKDILLEGILSYFTDVDKITHQDHHSEDMYSDEVTSDRNNRELVLQTEGTVILHVTFSVGQDRQLSREFIKYIKACGNQLLSSFTLSLVLSISKIDHCQEQIFDCLKKCIVKCYKDNEKQGENWWVREMVHEQIDVSDCIMKSVRQSLCVWDYVVQGLVKLGFTLMTSYGPRSVFGRVIEKRTAQRTPTQQACDLGARILSETFKMHSMAREEILETLLRNIMIGQEGACVTHYLDLLTASILAAPHTFLDSMNKIREVLDTLVFLPLEAAEGLIRALPPLLKISRHLKDSLLIVLRKSLFSRQLETRKVAVCGYIVLLKHFKVLGGGVSLSQASQSSSMSFGSSQLSVDIHQQAAPLAAGNEGLCLEILNNLRRSLTQHLQVRQTLYEGLYDVVSRNSQLSEPVLEFMTSHLYKYYDPDDDVIPPLRLNPCITHAENVCLNEPLAVLLHTIQLCLQKQRQSQSSNDDDDDDRPTVVAKLATVFESLTRRLLKTEMEDFELDKSADYNTSTSVGTRNTLFALLVLGSYESLIEYNIMLQTYR